MNPIFHPTSQLDPYADLHLDAEVLNAYTEDSLSTYEREQVLAHMAICGHCREVLYLAQELAEEPVERPVRVPQPVTLPLRSWFQTWRFVWVAAAACTAVIAGVVVLDMQRKPSSEATGRVDAGKVVPAEGTRIATPLPSSRALAMKVNPGEALVRQAGAPAEADTPQAARTTERDTGLTAAASAEPAPNESRDRDEAIEVAEVTENPAEIPHGAQTQYVPPIEPMSHFLPPDSSVPGKRSAKMLFQSSGLLRGSAHSVMAARADQAALHAGELFDPDVIVAHNAMLTRLPNGKMPISTVSSQNLLLAVDGSGSLFVSESQGYVWERVDTQWTGRAYEVRLQQAPDLGLGAFAGMPKSKSVAGPVFELVTDRLEIWVSSDGRSWKQE